MIGTHGDYMGFMSDDMDPRDYYSSSPSCLFKEVAPTYTDCAIYTMEDSDRGALISARRVYMACETEYDAAMKLVGSWQAWLKLTRNKLFMDGHPNTQWGGLKEWQQEREERDKAVAKKQLMKSAKSGNVSAQRALYDSKDGTRKAKTPEKKEQAKDEILIAAQERLKLIK